MQRPAASVGGEVHVKELRSTVSSVTAWRAFGVTKEATAALPLLRQASMLC